MVTFLFFPKAGQTFPHNHYGQNELPAAGALFAPEPPALASQKSSSFVATYLSMYAPFKKLISVPHNPQGVTVLLDRLRDMEHLTGERPQVILESTGNYSKPIIH